MLATADLVQGMQPHVVSAAKSRSFILGTSTLQHTTASSHVLVTCEGQTKKAASNPVSGM